MKPGKLIFFLKLTCRGKLEFSRKLQGLEKENYFKTA